MTIKYSYALASVTIVAGVNDVIRITEAAGTNSATIAAGTYYMRVDGAADDLALAIETALAAAGASTNTYSFTAPSVDTDPANIAVSWSLSRASGTDGFDVLWADAATTFDPGLIGYTAAKGSVDGDAQFNSVSPQLWFVANELATVGEPVFRADASQLRTVAGQVFTFERGGPYADYTLSFEFLSEARTLARGNSADVNATLEYWWRLARDGRRFELYEATVDAGTIVVAPSTATLIGTFHLDDAACVMFAPRRFSPGMPYYSVDLNLLGYTA